jgi:hypothetical protein
MKNPLQKLIVDETSSPSKRRDKILKALKGAKFGLSMPAGCNLGSERPSYALKRHEKHVHAVHLSH